MNRARHSRAFSLVEMLIVIAIIAVVGLLGLPLMGRSDAARTANSLARSISGDIQQARIMSQRDNRPYYVDFGQDLNGDGVNDCTLWRDLGNPPFNGVLDLADNNGDGVPDEVVGGEALIIGTESVPPYGRSFKAVALGIAAGGPAAGPPNSGGNNAVSFQDPVSGAVSTRFAANPDGSCSAGHVYVSSSSADPNAALVVYCVEVSPAGSAQVWRWTAQRAVWERL